MNYMMNGLQGIQVYRLTASDCTVYGPSRDPEIRLTRISSSSLIRPAINQLEFQTCVFDPDRLGRFVLSTT